MGEIRVGGHVIGAHGWEPAELAETVEEYSPADHNIDDVLEYVGDDKDLAAEVHASEKAGKGRKTLLAALEEVIEGGEDE